MYQLPRVYLEIIFPYIIMQMNYINRIQQYLRILDRDRLVIIVTNNQYRYGIIYHATKRFGIVINAIPDTKSEIRDFPTPIKILK